MNCNPIRMFEIPRAVDRYYSNEFNAVHVVRYWVNHPYLDSIEHHKPQIKKYRITNFFRSIFGKPLKKPKKPRRQKRSSLTVEFSGRVLYFYFKASRHAELAYQALDEFMKGIN
jgi:hypothetical protein